MAAPRGAQERVDALQPALGPAELRGERVGGLVERTAFATVPVTVEYTITPLGRSLAAIVDQLRGWSVTHVHEVRAAHTRFDARVAVTRPRAPGGSPVRAGAGEG